MDVLLKVLFFPLNEEFFYNCTSFRVPYMDALGVW